MKVMLQTVTSCVLLLHEATRRGTQKRHQTRGLFVFAWCDFVEEILNLFPCTV
jgi:hypothetical protein